MKSNLTFSKTSQKFLIFSIFFIFCLLGTYSQNEFITTWKTDNPGSSNDTSITIPTTGAGYNYDVDWDNDGTFDEFGLTGNVTHDFTSAGTYTIRIQGAFPRIYFNGTNNNDRGKIISIDQWGIIAWTSMENAFFGAYNLVGNATDAPDLSGVTNLSSMFLSAINFNQDISSWNTAAVTDMSLMFYNATAFNNGGQPLSWNTNAVTNLSSMFLSAINFNQDISSWNTAAVTDMSWMFYASAFNQDISSWNTSTITNMEGMFSDSPFNNGGQPLTWNTAAVTSMAQMFAGYTQVFNQDMSSWNTGAVTNMSLMFYDNTAFNNGGQPLSWNTSAVTDMEDMFGYASSFNQDISSWDTSQVTNMSSMFEFAINFNNGGQPMNLNITSLTSAYSMFFFASAFNQNISGWDFSNVVDTVAMFQNATAYNNGGQPLIMNIDIEYAGSMFAYATNFNQPISFLSTNNLSSVHQMFKNATAFNQNIGSWNVESVTFFLDMFDGATLSDANYDALLIGWDAQNLQQGLTFDGGNSQFCSPAAEAARTNMINNDGWIITDDGLFGGSCGLGIKDNEFDSSILLYPNPVEDIVIIESENLLESILVYDISGRVIFKTTIAENLREKRISLSDISSGLYFINVRSNKGQSIKKIVKK